MLKRKITETMLRWKNSTGKKTCLLIRGVRQCGKTYIAREFGREHYEDVVEINFVRQPEFARVFSGSLDVDDMVSAICIMTGRAGFVPGGTLLILDEIQDCPRARASLKFWAEDGRYDVIATGSLLGIQFRDEASIPVGYETSVEMFPLSFEEFLWASGIGAERIAGLEQYRSGGLIIPDAIHFALMEKLREYMAVGGMPDAVNEYLDSRSMQRVHMVHERILYDYQDDIARYASSGDRIKARNCFLSLPRQLTKENHKFQYSVVEKGGTARKFGSSLDWLTQAGMIRLSHDLRYFGFPLAAYSVEDNFRVYLCDIGLFNAMFGFEMKQAIMSDMLDGPAKGGIYESLVADIFAKRGIPLHFYKKDDSTLEIDFVIERDARPVPVEVKASKGSSRSLNEILKLEEVPLGYKLTSQNCGAVDKKITLPLYMAMVI
ncbi:MAG: ATP-binding protein [Firmicutes bacterium]|nr:ATP-binding protein [Bacillota bacterium]MBQ2456256.1 ATP-binding protein [Bacillota bacterium]